MVGGRRVLLASIPGEVSSYSFRSSYCQCQRSLKAFRKVILILPSELRWRVDFSSSCGRQFQIGFVIFLKLPGGLHFQAAVFFKDTWQSVFLFAECVFCIVPFHIWVPLFLTTDLAASAGVISFLLSAVLVVLSLVFNCSLLLMICCQARTSVSVVRMLNSWAGKNYQLLLYLSCFWRSELAINYYHRGFRNVGIEKPRALLT